MGFSRHEYGNGLPFPSPGNHILSELSTMARLPWVALLGMAHSFIGLNKAVDHMIRLISFLWLWFLVHDFNLPTDGKGKRLMEDSWWENWLRDKLGLVLMSGAMLSKSSIQFSVEGWGCVPSLLFDLRSNYGGGNEDNVDLLQKVPCMLCYTQCSQPCSRPPPTPSSTRDSYPLTGKSGTVSYGVTAPFSWVLVSTRFCLYHPRICFPSPV